MSSTPSPASVFATKARVAAPVDLTKPAAPVRPSDPVTHDGVVKAKHLRRGQSVRPYVLGTPRGAVRVVDSVRRVQGGAFVEITWSSMHSREIRPAAYRWFDEDLVGTIPTDSAVVYSTSSR